MAEPKKQHGGYRPGAGRKPAYSEIGRNFTLRLPPEVEAELTAALEPEESLADLFRSSALIEARRRAQGDPERGAVGQFTVRLPPEIVAELTAALDTDETPTDFLRDSALIEARRRAQRKS